eukprot:14786649-Heterocapsa_arctica.AAC.1
MFRSAALSLALDPSRERRIGVAFAAADTVQSRFQSRWRSPGRRQSRPGPAARSLRTGPELWATLRDTQLR